MLPFSPLALRKKKEMRNSLGILLRREGPDLEPEKLGTVLPRAPAWLSLLQQGRGSYYGGVCIKCFPHPILLRYHTGPVIWVRDLHAMATTCFCKYSVTGTSGLPFVYMPPQLLSLASSRAGFLGQKSHVLYWRGICPPTFTAALVVIAKRQRWA